MGGISIWQLLIVAVIVVLRSEVETTCDVCVGIHIVTGVVGGNTVL